MAALLCHASETNHIVYIYIRVSAIASAVYKLKEIKWKNIYIKFFFFFF